MVLHYITTPVAECGMILEGHHSFKKGAQYENPNFENT
jgi:hypothetical protein